MGVEPNCCTSLSYYPHLDPHLRCTHRANLMCKRCTRDSNSQIANAINCLAGSPYRPLRHTSNICRSGRNLTYVQPTTLSTAYQAEEIRSVIKLNNPWIIRNKIYNFISNYLIMIFIKWTKNTIVIRMNTGVH